jgi:hypothetical protein
MSDVISLMAPPIRVVIAAQRFFRLFPAFADP